MSVMRLKANEAGRDFATGDIHGCFDRLHALLEAAGFDEKVDRLLSVGDLVDRGPDSLAAVEWLDRPWFYAVRGNHEQMAINFAKGLNHAFHYERNGGRWFINLPDAEQARIARLFETLPLAIEVEVGGNRIGIVHAEVPNNNWRSFDNYRKEHEEVALWARDRIAASDTSEVAGIDLVLVGHSPLDQIARLGNVVYIDTGAVFGAPMALLCLTTDELLVERRRPIYQDDGA